MGWIMSSAHSTKSKPPFHQKKAHSASARLTNRVPRLLATNENPTSMSNFTDFFAPNGTLVVLGSVSQGSQEILASRQAMLPVNGSVRWNVCLPCPRDSDKDSRKGQLKTYLVIRIAFS